MNSAGQPSPPLVGLPPEQFAAAFPFHLALDRDLRLVQAGATIRRICPDVQPGASLAQLFRSLRPEGSITMHWVLQNSLRFFLLEHLASKLQLRGEFIVLPDRDSLLFLGSPWFTDTSEIAAFGLGFEDFAIHDPVVDMLQVFQASKLALADAKKLAAKLTAQRAELRAANDRLRQQEADARKLALIAARTDNAVVLTDAEGRTVWVNEGFTRLTGYTREEIQGRKPGAVLQGPGTDPETVQHIRERLCRGEGFSVEILNYGKHGRSYWLAVEVQPIYDDQGRLTNFMAIEMDITARRAAQQRLAIQFEVSRALAEAANFATAFPQVLQVICENLGWQVGQLWRLAGGRLRSVEVWHPPTVSVSGFISASRAVEFAKGIGLPGRIWAGARPTWIADVTTDANFPRGMVAAEEGLRGAFGFPVLVRGELWGVLEFFSRRIEEPDEALLKTFGAVGNQIGQFIVRREAEEALLETNTLQRAILEGANYSIISTAPDGVIRTFNSAAERMLGYTSEEMVGKATPAIFHDFEEVKARAAELTGELGRKVEAGFEAFVAKALLGKPDEREWTYIRKDGSRFPVLLSVTALFDEDGKVTGYLGVASDITERKRVASELVKAKDEAETASRAKSDFLAMMSHEIRTPMNAIIGMTNLLLDTPLNEQQREFAGTAGRSGEALLEIINDILDFSKIEAGQLRLELERFEVRPLVAGVLELLEPRARQKGLALSVDIATDVPEALRSDDGRLRQVLVNLVGNGIKFTERGKIIVRVRCLSQNGSHARLQVEVEDSGPGISATDQAQLFQPFKQVNTASSRKHGGTGLGLAISRRIVELLGGKIGVRSTIGVGSAFWFEFEADIAPAADADRHLPPLHARSPDETEFFKKPSEHAGTAKPLRILVAEDHDTNRRLALLMLEKLGHRADVAGNGREAVEAWERFGYDIILMDCQMPELDGFEATREIRRRAAARPARECAPVRIIALTANALTGDRERCLAAGMDGYLSKPVRLEALAAALGKPATKAVPEQFAIVPKSANTLEASITQLSDELGNEVALELLSSFLNDTPSRLADLRQLAAKADRNAFALTAHSLAGNCSVFGLESMRELGLKLEEMAGQEAIGNFEPAILELEQLFLDMRPTLERLREAMHQARQP